MSRGSAQRKRNTTFPMSCRSGNRGASETSREAPNKQRLQRGRSVRARRSRSSLTLRPALVRDFPQSSLPPKRKLADSSSGISPGDSPNSSLTFPKRCARNPAWGPCCVSNPPPNAPTNRKLSSVSGVRGGDRANPALASGTCAALLSTNGPGSTFG
jgi:hypothetical protein